MTQTIILSMASVAPELVIGDAQEMLFETKEEGKAKILHLPMIAITADDRHDFLCELVEQAARLWDAGEANAPKSKPVPAIPKRKRG